MPCSFCGTIGHNRRTCQRFDLLIQERNELEINRNELEINRNELERNRIIREEAAENRIFENAQIRQELERRRIQIPIPIHSPTAFITPPITPSNAINNINHFPSLQQIDISNLNLDNLNLMDIWGGDSDDDYGNELQRQQSLLISPSLTPRKNVIVKSLVECTNEPCSAKDCAICMEDLTSVDLMITRCGHQFHSTCMITHLKRQDNCPLCRGILCN